MTERMIMGRFEEAFKEYENIRKKCRRAVITKDEQMRKEALEEGSRLLGGLDPDPGSLTIKLFEEYRNSRYERRDFLYIADIYGYAWASVIGGILKDMGVIKFVSPLDCAMPARTALAFREYGFDASSVRKVWVKGQEIPVFVFTQRNLQ